MNNEPAYSFGYFRLLPQRRCLLAGEQTVKLGARAFDLLVALIASPGRVLTKNELLETVWPRLVVEENNLNVQIVSLRKVLGHAAIATIPGRGYRFVLPVSAEGDRPAATSPPAVSSTVPSGASLLDAPAPPSTNLIGEAPLLYGRGDDVEAVLALLLDHAVVTVAGAGGVGKTRLGQAVAHRLLSGFPDGVWWVELAAHSDPSSVAALVAAALGAKSDGLRPATSVVVSALRSQRSLLVLDNCEHLLDGVAAFLLTLRRSAPDVRILLTSQEALKTADEHVYRLATLALPAVQAGALPLTVSEVAASGAGALFVARARAVAPRFQLTPANVEGVVEICRCLDGIPLAIELAAARLPLLGVEGVRSRLKERFKVLTGGTRAVLRRHQTLRAALEWSHGLLSAAEQIVFRRLGVFSGGFTLESAQRVAEDEIADMWDVLEHLGSLVDKSLVLAEGAGVPRYRMLETTRLFALEQLASAGETESMLRRHAVAIEALLAGVEAGRRGRAMSPQEKALMAAEADNIRAAYDWLATTDSPADDLLAIELASVGIDGLWLASGVSEAFERTNMFSGRIGSHTPAETAARFWLAVGCCGAIVGSAEAYDAAMRAVELYRQLGDDERLYSALTYRIGIGARRGDSASLGSLVAEARGVEHAGWASSRKSEFLWACYRWLQAEGRPEEALQAALERAAVNEAAGDTLQQHTVLGDNVADCELSAGRVDAAEARCRAALRIMGGQAWGRSHVMETLAFVCVDKGDDAAAVDCSRAAIDASRDMGMHFRLLEAIALVAARQGRLHDAAWATGHVDRLYALRGEVRWPAAKRRRAAIDALLAAGLEAGERRRLHDDGAAADLEAAFERGFSVTAAEPRPAAPRAAG